MSARAPSDLMAIGILMMLVANFLFATLDTAVKWMLTLGLPSLQLAFFRYAGQFAISSAGIFWHRDWTRLRAGGRPWMVALRGITLVCATMGNFFALTYLPLTITSAIMFSAPVFVCLLSVRFLGETVGPWRWSAILLGFIGVLIVVQPFGESFHWAAPLCVFNALMMATYSLMTRALSHDVSTASLQFYGGATGTLILAPLAIAVWHPPAELSIWLGLIFLGILGWCGHELLTRAHVIAPANALMPFTYSFLIFMTIFDVFLFAHIPNAREALGIAVIVTAGLVIWYRGRT